MYISVSILIIYPDKGMLTPNSLRRLESGSVVTTAGKMFISTGAQQLSQTLSPSNLVESQVVKPGIRIRIILPRRSGFPEIGVLKKRKPSQATYDSIFTNNK
jgi:hypothetical protein